MQAHQELKDEFGGFFKLAIPIFHCYGRKLQCQVKQSSSNITVLLTSPKIDSVRTPETLIGLSDGEGMERMWSFLRRFIYDKRNEAITQGGYTDRCHCLLCKKVSIKYRLVHRNVNYVGILVL